MTERTRLHSTIVKATGIGIGVVWLAMAVAALRSAARGLAANRSDWALAWGLVGVLLLAAGSAAAFGTWWHENRVLDREGTD